MEQGRIFLSTESSIGADEYLVSVMRRERNNRRLWLFFAVGMLVSVAAFIAKA